MLLVNIMVLVAGAKLEKIHFLSAFTSFCLWKCSIFEKCKDFVEVRETSVANNRKRSARKSQAAVSCRGYGDSCDSFAEEAICS